MYIYFWKQSIWGAEHGSFTLNLTEEDNWDRPFKHFSISGNHLVNIYCNEYGARLGSGSHTYNIDGRYQSMTAAYAKRLSSAREETSVHLEGTKYVCSPGTNEYQYILWHYPISTTATADTSWTNPDNPTIEFKNDYVSKTVESIDDDYYRIAFKLKFSGGGTNSNVTIGIKDEDGNNVNCEFKIYTNKSCTTEGTITSGDIRYIKIKKEKLNSYRKIKLYATYNVADKYSGKFANYIEGNGTKNSQHLIGVYVEQEPSDAKHSTSRTITVAQPRLITTKYIKKITSEDGKTLYDVTDSWNPNNWETENLKPIVTVNTNKGITETGRYNLTPQDARNFNITSGDIITYNIRVYNVGNETADLSDTSLKSINENKILKDGYIYDYYDNHLEFVSNNKNWQKDSSGVYKIKATELTNKIASYEEAKENGKEDNIESWSKSIQITFRVKDKEQSKYSITNNGNTTQREDATVKFLKSVTTKDKDGNDVETVFDKEPEVEVDTSKKVGEDNRIIINANTPDVTVMDGDTLTYCMRYYSTALNKTELNYKAIDKFRRRVRI